MGVPRFKLMQSRPSGVFGIPRPNDRYLVLGRTEVSPGNNIDAVEDKLVKVDQPVETQSRGIMVCIRCVHGKQLSRCLYDRSNTGGIITRTKRVVGI
jgi:hypothetical protein